jgi:hypothetical protein
MADNSIHHSGGITAWNLGLRFNKIKDLGFEWIEG